MHCFHHAEMVARGICKACGKALCLPCITETDGGLACSLTCKAYLLRVNGMLTQNTTHFDTYRRLLNLGSWILGIAGFWILAAGGFLLGCRSGSILTPLLFLLGAAFCAGCLYMRKLIRTYATIAVNKED